MDLRDVEYFAVINEHRHLGRAAEALGLSQPALSLSLRRLERAVQAKLFERTPKGLELTRTGSTLLSHVQRLRLARDDLTREIADLGEGRAGHLRIGVSTGLPENLLGTASGALLKEGNKVSVRIALVTTDVLLPALRHGEFDLALTTIPAAAVEDLVFEQIADDEFVVYAAASHPLARRRLVTLADISRERWTRSASSRASWQELRRTLEEHGMPPPEIALESDSTAVRLHAMASSNLLSFISRPFVAQASLRSRFVQLRVTEPRWRRCIGVCYRKGAYLPPLSRRLIELLKSSATA